MKAGVAMLVTAFLRARAEGLRPPGDLVLCVLADEEAGGNLGAKFLVEEHPELFEGVRYALGEFGGFSQGVGGRRFYPIQVAEKQICWLAATVRGPGGHGALVHRGGTVARLGRLLRDLDRTPLPVHVTPVVRQMLETMAAALPRPQATVLRSVLKPRFTVAALRLMGDQAGLLEPALRNTVNATIVRGGEKINVVPSEIQVELDGRGLPGYGPEALMAEVREVIGDDVELELVRHDPGPAQPDLGLFETLAGVLRELDPEGIPVPLLQIGVTDGRFFSRLGIQTYGFLPMRLPKDFGFARLIHAADERIPVDALEFGAEAVWRAIQRFH
jgi:acetylornithine deacetylase/succinyl-diaminopimelate desuccinylase-like protein